MLFTLIFVLAMASIACTVFLVAIPIIIILTITTWCKTHSIEATKNTIVALWDATLSGLCSALIIFMLYILLSAIPVLMWICIIPVAGIGLLLMLAFFTIAIETWK